MRKDRINIIYEDKDIIVVDKQANLLTISTDNEKEKTLFHKVLTYLRQKNKNNKVFIVHRLDKDTSGLVVFAKSEIIKRNLQSNWEKFERKYIAVVEGIVTKKEDTIKSYLKETKTLLVYSTNVKDETSKLAITKYKLLKTSKSFSLLEINILTGRKNQIRVHMKDISHPIIGDKKYLAKTNPINRLGLHAYYLKLIHPVSKKELILESKVPIKFNNMFKS